MSYPVAASIGSTDPLIGHRLTRHWKSLDQTSRDFIKLPSRKNTSLTPGLVLKFQKDFLLLLESLLSRHVCPFRIIPNNSTKLESNNLFAIRAASSFGSKLCIAEISLQVSYLYARNPEISPRSTCLTTSTD